VHAALACGLQPTNCDPHHKCRHTFRNILKKIRSIPSQQGTIKAGERESMRVSIAIEHIRESDEEVVRCAAWASSHLGTERAVATLVGLRNHPDADVRHAVANCIELRKHPEGVNILTALMEDENEVVRDWATFALGNDDVIEGGVRHFTDSPEIRAAFRRRLDDSYEEARREAIWGLALRNDPLGVKLLLKHLESEEWWNGDKDAAEELLGLPPDTSVEELRNGLRRLLA